MRKTAIIMLLLSGAAFANEGRVFLVGSVIVADDKKTNVSMREEEIVITLHKNYYEIDVSFKFYNDGPEEKILLGFPIHYTYLQHERAKTVILKSYINGKQLSPKDYVIKEESEEYRPFNAISATRWLLREVVFAGNAYTESRVVYRMIYSDDTEGEYAGYTYGTGRNWKGPIGKMTVIVNHGDDVIVGGVYMDDDPYYNRGGAEKLPNPLWEANGRYKYVLENINPKTKNDMITIPIQRYNNIYNTNAPFDCSHRGVFGCQFDCWPWDPYNCGGEKGRDWLGGSWHWDAVLLYKDSADIRPFTKNQIRLFINFFFARHGYDFKNKLYRDYFRQIELEQQYDGDYYFGFEYKVNPNFKEKDFNEFERKNIDYLLKLEKMIPETAINAADAVTADTGAAADTAPKTKPGVWLALCIVAVLLLSAAVFVTVKKSRKGKA